jgi:hypothetical protein
MALNEPLFYKRVEVLAQMGYSGVFSENLLFQNVGLWQAIAHIVNDIMENQKFLQTLHSHIISLDDQFFLDEDEMVNLAGLQYLLRITDRIYSVSKQGATLKENILQKAVWGLIQLWHLLIDTDNLFLNDGQRRVFLDEFRLMMEKAIKQTAEKERNKEYNRKLTVIADRLFNKRGQRIIRNDFGVYDPFSWTITNRGRINKADSKSNTRSRSGSTDPTTMRGAFPNKYVNFSGRRNNKAASIDVPVRGGRNDKLHERSITPSRRFANKKNKFPAGGFWQVKRDQQQHKSSPVAQDSFDEIMKQLTTKWKAEEIARKANSDDDDAPTSYNY